MIAKLPPLVQDLKDVWPLVTAAVVAVGVMLRRFKAWITAEVVQRLDDGARRFDQLDGKVDELHRYARYHLGPNGDAVPIHTRLRMLERVHDLEEGP